MRTLKGLFLAVACLLGAQLVASELPSVKEASLNCHRLPVNVEPTRYDLHLKFQSLDSDVYEGQVDIAVGFSKMSTKRIRNWGLQNVPCAQQYDENTIVLHAGKSLEIQEIKITSEPVFIFIPIKEQKERDIVEIIHDNENQMIAIKVKDGINPDGRGQIKINFKGRLREDKRGVYLSTYNDGKQEYKHIVSQFQPTFARTAFPCFDEPRFRVPFSVRISHPKGLTAYGNTEVQEVSEENGLIMTRFATTPAMPVHMVTFIVGHFDKPLEVFSTRSLPGKSKEKVRTIRVITAPGKQEAGSFALDVAKKSLEWFEKYIDYEFPLDKLDVIAIADLARDNTESWGLVFVRDTLLWVDDETKPETKITTALNIAHAVAHQWFGNLISVNWWSDLWITEGVAAQFSFSIVQGLYSNFQSEYFIRLAMLSGVLQADQAGNMHPLSPPEKNLRTGEQIIGIFDKLEFMKSASMAQMVQEAVGRDQYQKMLKKLIKEHAYKTLTFDNYQRTVLSSNVKSTIDHLPDLLKTFPKYTGVPVVNCRLNQYWRRYVKLDLEPFHKARNDVNGELVYPLVKVAIKANTVFSGGRCGYRNTAQIIITHDFPITKHPRVPDWFILKQRTSDHFIKIDRHPSVATYYRTRYSDELYSRLQRAIKERLISPMDKLQILDDANSLAQAELITSYRFKSLLNSYSGEDHPAVVIAILTALNTLRSLSPEDASFSESNKAILSIFKDYGFEVSGNENVIMQRAREVVLTSLIQQGNKQVVDAALEAFDQAHGKVALFLRQPVYTAVVLSGSSDQVNQLLSHLAGTKSYEEQIRLVAALTLSKDKEVLTKVKSWLGSSGLKAETTRPFLDTISAALS